MSAIFGILHLNGQPVAPANLDRMNAALAHRGSDGGGVWTTDAAGVGQRLMCFTPEDRFERQPLLGNDGQCVLVSDGRIDNRDRLISEKPFSWVGICIPTQPFLGHESRNAGGVCGVVCPDTHRGERFRRGYISPANGGHPSRL